MPVGGRVLRVDQDRVPEPAAAVEVVRFALLVVAEEREDVGGSDEAVEGGEARLLRCGCWVAHADGIQSSVLLFW